MQTLFEKVFKCSVPFIELSPTDLTVCMYCYELQAVIPSYVSFHTQTQFDVSVCCVNSVVCSLQVAADHFCHLVPK